MIMPARDVLPFIHWRLSYESWRFTANPPRYLSAEDGP